MKDILSPLSTRTPLPEWVVETASHSHGVSLQKCFEELSLTDPVVVTEANRACLEAGGAGGVQGDRVLTAELSLEPVSQPCKRVLC